MKTKTILTLLLIIGVNFLRAEVITIDMIKYSLDENTHTAIVVGVERERGIAYITEANVRSSVIYKGTSYHVTGIRYAAFEDCLRLVTASIPSSVLIIEEGAFRRCKALTRVNISAREIEDRVFESCVNLQYITLNEGVVKIGDVALQGKYTSITIPNSVTQIGESAFVSSQLQSVKFGSGIKRIERSAFRSTALREVVIPQNVTSIGVTAFSGCKNLTKVTIHNRVKEIEDAAFADCTSLQTFDLANDNPYFTVEDGVLFNKDKTILIQYPSGKKNSSYIIPSSVKKIAARAFENVPSLRSVQISNSVVEIEYCAFSDCKNLTSVKMGKNVKKIGACAFSRCRNLSDIIIPDNVEEIGAEAFRNCEELTDITLPGSVQKVKDHAFYGCTSLYIKVPKHTQYWDDAFYNVDEVEFYSTSNPVEEQKKALEEQKRRQYEAEQKRQREIQAKKEQEEREKKLKKEAEERKRREEQAKKEQEKREREEAYSVLCKILKNPLGAQYIKWTDSKKSQKKAILEKYPQLSVSNKYKLSGRISGLKYYYNIYSVSFDFNYERGNEIFVSYGISAPSVSRADLVATNICEDLKKFGFRMSSYNPSNGEFLCTTPCTISGITYNWLKMSRLDGDIIIKFSVSRKSPHLDEYVVYDNSSFSSSNISYTHSMNRNSATSSKLAKTKAHSDFSSALDNFYDVNEKIQLNWLAAEAYVGTGWGVALSALEWRFYMIEIAPISFDFGGNFFSLPPHFRGANDIDLAYTPTIRAYFPWGDGEKFATFAVGPIIGVESYNWFMVEGGVGMSKGGVLNGRIFVRYNGDISIGIAIKLSSHINRK